MILASVSVRNEHVRQLIGLLDPTEPLARKLGLALKHRSAIVVLTVQERVRLLQVLDDPPAELATLRQSLLDQFKRRDERAERERQPRSHGER